MTLRSAWLATSLTIAALAAPGLATAGDAARGAKLAYTCHGCHGIPNYENAYPVYHVPKLGGQHQPYLVSALKEYASLDRNHPTMHAQAVTMSEQDRQDITTYLVGEQLKSTGRAVGTAPKAGQTCVACHGNDGVGLTPDYPNLAGQHEDYIRQALHSYKSGVRKNPIMSGMAANLTEQDINELAAYYSSQRPGLCSTDEIRKNGKCPGL
jgi:cytochrome c553